MQPGRLAAALLMVAVSTCTTSRSVTPSVHRAVADQPAQTGPSAAPVKSPVAAAAVEPEGDFDPTVKPILEKHCRPCHFEGGVMYDKLPFDRAATIRTLGERLFTRIKDPQEQQSIRAFLRQQNPR